MARHILVIGAGIVGVCTAAYLQRDGHRVTLVDRDAPGNGASFGNAGSLSPSACLPVAMPGVWKRVPRWLRDPDGPLRIRPHYLPRALPWLARFLAASREREVERIATAMRALLAPIFDAYAPLLRNAGADDLVRRTGCLYAFATDASHAAARWGMALRERLGVALEPVGPDRIRALAPGIDAAYARGWFAPDNGSTLDPHALTARLAAAFVRDGGTLLERDARAFRFRDGRPVAAVANGGAGDLEADDFVIAAGAWSATLARALGRRFPLETQRGYHVTIADSGVALDNTVMSPAHGLMVNPMSMGLRLAGTVELAGLAAPPDWARADALLAIGRRMFPGLRTAGVSRWMGHRPCLPDSLPVIGRDLAHANCWYAFGHQHVGMCAAASTGRELAALIAGRATAIDLAPFSPARF
jgi:D-amino-acid dehydrogenase